MTASDESLDYTYNPFYKYHEPSDYSIFYATLFISFLIALFLFVINVYFCCFSEHKHYWTDSYQGEYHFACDRCIRKELARSTFFRILPIYFVLLGNYWILPFWVRSPAKQVPLDLHELEWVIRPNKAVYQTELTEYLELERKESDI